MQGKADDTIHDRLIGAINRNAVVETGEQRLKRRQSLFGKQEANRTVAARQQNAQDDLALALYAEAFALETDREGRIVLPDELVAFAGLGDQVTFLGAGRIFQIWEPEAAKRRRAEARERARANGFTLPGATPPQQVPG